MLYFLTGAVCWAISFMQFMEKGFVFSKKYLYASEAERKKMDKKIYYRQAGIEWLLFGSYFILMGMSTQFKIGWLEIIAWISLILAISYSLIFTYRITTKK